MIRKTLLTIPALGFALLVLGLSVLKTTAFSSPRIVQTGSSDITPTPTMVEKLVEEEEEREDQIEESSAATEAADKDDKITSPQKEVDYYLPYPGILPDHPLYFLKMIRDRIWLLLTTDPLKKAEVLLLFADKRIGAARVLVEGGKPELGLTTATKAEKYLEKAINQEKLAQEKETKIFLEKIKKASLKHEEVLVALSRSLEGKEDLFEQLLNYSRQGLKKIEERLKE